MVVIMDSYRLEHRQWVNKTQLREHLASRCRKYSVLGEDVDAPKEFFSVITQTLESRLDNIGIGICSMGIGLQPEVYLHPKTNKLVVGFNSSLCVMSLSDGTVTFCHELNSPFYEITPIYSLHQILIQHEVGIVMLTEEGKILWKYDGDIITGLQHCGNTLELQFMDTPSVKLSLDVGRLLV